MFLLWGRFSQPSARSDEEAGEPTFVRSAACARVLLIDVVVLFLASLAQTVGEEQVAQAPKACYARADQVARESDPAIRSVPRGGKLAWHLKLKQRGSSVAMQK